ncbi:MULTISPECIES: LarC family nickel insertion protein [unclassified Mesorhizobium]|uniref:LarC family nickel insertion protein n=1 Tax=unclassified Mesorhizobium TaxID=325217 RepID=UPI0024799D38|nr:MULTISPECIES: LarC family nickel insertion protein [unclassified Mesorhizobium]
MRRVHLDAVGGIAGDMFVAAMLDALPDLRERVLADGAAVLPVEAGGIAFEEGESLSMRVRRFGLVAKRAMSAAAPHAHANAYGDDDGHHHHHDRNQIPDEAHAGSFADMVARIKAADLHDGTAARAIAILTIIGEAEAAIHRVPVERVHFHEIADWDSLVDVVCAGSIAAALDKTVWSVSALPRGGGLVHTAHGLLPVPAPATAAILTGFEWRDDGISGERVTPTGAAILKHLTAPGAGGTSGRLVSSGTGAGTRHLPGMPNILRVLVLENEVSTPSDTISVIEFEIDDMTGEEMGVACDRLRATDGVLDLSVGQRLGKKGRPASSFRLLARPELADQVTARCFAETSTIGLRLREERRLVLFRENVKAAGLAVKAVLRPSGITRKVESDALRGGSLAERRAMKWQAETTDDE